MTVRTAWELYLKIRLFENPVELFFQVLALAAVVPSVSAQILANSLDVVQEYSVKERCFAPVQFA